MSESNLDELLLEVEKIKAIGKRNSKIILSQAFLFMLIGIGLAYLFRHLETEAHYIKSLGLLSQIIAFSAAILLSDKFLSIPVKYSGVHNHAIATAMIAPICLWQGSFMYIIATMFLNIPYSNVWTEAITIVCFGLGMVIFAAGSVGEALSLKVKDKSAAVNLGWYMVVFSLGLQIYISLVELEVLSLSVT
jgi:hypothetical protein